jgi:hypothetical protein
MDRRLHPTAASVAELRRVADQHALKAVSPTSLEPRLEVSLKEHQYGGFLRA